MEVDSDPDEEEMKYVRLYDKRECHWRMFLRKMMEGWTTRKQLYMIRGGMYA